MSKLGLAFPRMTEFPGLPPYEDWPGIPKCADADPEIFFPPHGENVTEARAICAECPVRVECYEWAIDNREPFGVWAGLSERQRRQVWMARERRVAA